MLLFSLKRRCPECHGRNVRRSIRYGILDTWILPLFMLRPFRCDRCDRRYFGLFFAARVKMEAKSSLRATPPNP